MKDVEGGRFRRKVLPIVLGLVSLVLLGRLLSLQIVKGREYRSLAEGNRIRTETIHAPRGIIYDRNGYPLVRNVPGFRIKEADETKVISHKEALAVYAKGGKEEGELEVDSLREYLYAEELSHMLGYLAEASEEEVKSSRYQPGDRTGRVGIEEKYENHLRGVDGKKLVEIDAKLSKKRSLGEVEARVGKDLWLTIDLSLQRSAFSAMSAVKKGALIVTDPRTGEVLALVAKPSFDPNLFTLGENYNKDRKGNTYKNAQQIVSDDEQRPLFNRAISGAYPPGSTFKLITAAAGLEGGVISKDTKIEDVGVLRIGPFSFPNWYFTQYGKLDGVLDIVSALKRSNDIFFYKTAEMLGLEGLERMAKKFGVGQTLGIDLSEEATGLFPNDEWKRRVVGDKWYLGDTYHLGIGQGYLLTTPLQMNMWTAVIANGGRLYEPHLLKSQKSPAHNASQRAAGGKIKNQNFLRQETVALIQEGMRQACSPGGTGWPLFNFKVKEREVETACKTGTSEFGDPRGRTHAWFTVFAPVGDPTIVVTVLVEEGGEGSNVAAPIAKKILEEWFSR